MKSGIVTVFKKELARFFGDKRLFITSVIMPGLLIYIIYSLMGNSMASMIDGETESYKAAAVNMPESIVQALEKYNFEVENTDISHIEKIKGEISSGEYSLLAVFPENFAQVIADYKNGADVTDVPNVELYYNSANINSSKAYSQTVAVLDEVEKSISNVFDINLTENPDQDPYDLATKEDTTGTLLSMILPMILMTLMFSSCVALAPESIAGEKERGTIAALLITPMPRSQIILGKVCALSVMALLSGLSSFLGTFLSIPNLMGAEGETISTDVYKISDFVWLIVLILTTVLLYVTLISIISTLSKSVKEAGTMVMPLMLLVMFVSFITMNQTEPPMDIYLYAIPIYNTVEGFAQIFAFKASGVNLVVTAAANVVYSLVGVFVLTKLFDNEKVMFN